MCVEVIREVTTAERAVIEIPRTDVEARVSNYLGAPWTLLDAISHEDHDLIEMRLTNSSTLGSGRTDPDV